MRGQQIPVIGLFYKGLVTRYSPIEAQRMKVLKEVLKR